MKKFGLISLTFLIPLIAFAGGDNGLLGQVYLILSICLIAFLIAVVSAVRYFINGNNKTFSLSGIFFAILFISGIIINTFTRDTLLKLIIGLFFFAPSLIIFSILSARKVKDNNSKIWYSMLTTSLVLLILNLYQMIHLIGFDLSIHLYYLIPTVCVVSGYRYIKSTSITDNKIDRIRLFLHINLIYLFTLIVTRIFYSITTNSQEYYQPYIMDIKNILFVFGLINLMTLLSTRKKNYG